MKQFWWIGSKPIYDHRTQVSSCSLSPCSVISQQLALNLKMESFLGKTANNKKRLDNQFIQTCHTGSKDASFIYNNLLLIIQRWEAATNLQRLLICIQNDDKQTMNMREFEIILLVHIFLPGHKNKTPVLCPLKVGGEQITRFGPCHVSLYCQDAQSLSNQNIKI